MPDQHEPDRGPRKEYWISLGKVAVVLTAAWAGFLVLSQLFLVQEAFALIMVWASVLLLLAAFFPGLLEHIKKIKFKEFEIELREAISKYSAEDFLSRIVPDEFILAEKTRFSALSKLLEMVRLDLKKPVLLIVNLADPEGWISRHALFIYLFFLDLTGAKTTVLFISKSPRPRRLSEIKLNEVYGVVSGKELLRLMFRHYKECMNIYAIGGIGAGKASAEADHSRLWDEFFGAGSVEFYRSIESTLGSRSLQNDVRFDMEDLNLLFYGNLAREVIRYPLGLRDLQKIQSALESRGEYLIAERDGFLDSIILVRDLSVRLAKRVMEFIIEAESKKKADQ